MLRICEVNDRWSLDGSRGGNGTHYINHSCVPNAFMQILYDHILFIALRDIGAGERSQSITNRRYIPTTSAASAAPLRVAAPSIAYRLQSR
jgi:hypothetical protein